jgi:hypothetical protein
MSKLVRRRALAALIPLAGALFACSKPGPASEAEARAPAEPDAFERQVAEYVREFPHQATYDFTVRFTGGDPAKLNTWAVGSEPALVRAGQDVLPRTNNDTFIKGAALFLENGPVVLESRAPSRTRFSSIQLIDDRNANYRNMVYPAGKYTLYFGAKPDGVEGEAIEVPSLLSIVLVRVELRDKNDARDVAAATEVFNGIGITGREATRFPKVDLLRGYPPEVAAEANRRMDEVFATVPFTKMVVGPGKEPGTDVSYLYHAAGTRGGWGGPDPSHSAYERLLLDAHGDEMTGSRGVYTLTTGEPPVAAFWSVTVYDTERGGFLHPNKHDRYHINGTLARRNADGSVTFMFKSECEGTDSNCLEVPAGRFELVARYYLPRDEIIAGAWTLPRAELVGE